MKMPPRKVLLIGGAAVALLVAVVIVIRRRAASLEAAEGSAAGMLPASLTSTEGAAKAARLGLVLPGTNAVATPGAGIAAEAPAAVVSSSESSSSSSSDVQTEPLVLPDPWAYLNPSDGSAPLITSEPLPGYLYGPTEQNPDAPYVSPTLDLDQGIGSTIAAQTVPGPIAAAPPATGTFIASTPAETAARLGYDDTAWAM